MKLEDAVVGRQVKYTPYKMAGKDNWEYGVITSVNDKYVFVRYGSDIHSKATNPSDIEYC